MMSAKHDRNLDSKRAGFAYNQVAGWGSTWRKDAVNLVKGLPITLRTQGLPVTLATLMSGGKIHKRQLARLIEEWVLDEAPRKPLEPWSSSKSGINNPGQRLLSACLKSDRASHLAAQAEAIAVLDYVKLFAAALWEGDEKTGEEQDHV